ncbi:adenosylcobinamide-GDP ribazoletransferase [Peteryoungia ipomoeae]|uniref:Adenosylcobinamide-GDP ribazoletransferase n=1 Tax=Peteryoungia ipomoeae TaxID=1210932 RepID=A0A4S8P7Y9_9HYPH|nr:adenosylcobinamide-GDP ribazoletransferase [Peteryoungia ipomoeae]THV24922.1 adenosylcobinamide-GDP ribazoletransferase [Peteryoungia ipomoeae]
MSLWRETMAETARAVAFLSRIPMPDKFFVGHDGSLSDTVRAFPLAAIVIALPSALTVLLLAETTHAALLVSLVAVTVLTLLTGALHEDGLCDTADGLGGGRDKERALEIMKDSRIGTYGAVALILSIALRATALATVIEETSPLAAACVVLGSAAFSRTAIVWHWASLPGARSSGVAASVGAPSASSARQSYGLGAALVVLLLVFLIPPASLTAAIVASSMTVFAFTRYVRRRLEGHTGDTLGATQQVAEMAFLVSLAFLI